MNPNLTAYYWAEQTNRERLANRAARAWRAEEAAGVRSGMYHVTSVRCVALAGLIRLTSCLRGISVPGARRPFASLGGAPS